MKTSNVLALVAMVIAGSVLAFVLLSCTAPPTSSDPVAVSRVETSPARPAPVTTSPRPTADPLAALTADERTSVAVYVTFARDLLHDGVLSPDDVTVLGIVRDMDSNYGIGLTVDQAVTVRSEILEP